MRKEWSIVILLFTYLTLFFIGFIGSYVYINANKNTKAAMTASAIPIDNYSEISNRPQNLIEEEKSYIEKRKKMYPKEVFLTFDDGPSSNNTSAILKVLKANNIKATFFVVGKSVQQYPQIVKELVENGMCIMPHSYTHEYSIYKSTDTYFQDLEACSAAIEKVTGIKNQLYTRLPGGSDNRVSNKVQLKKIRDTLKGKYIYYVDWNVSSADAAGEKVPMERIKENVINQCKGKKLAVVLMHDSYPKTTTAEALPYIIKYLKNEGFEFRTFDDITPEEEKFMIKEGVINR